GGKSAEVNAARTAGKWRLDDCPGRHQRLAGDRLRAGDLAQRVMTARLADQIPGTPLPTVEGRMAACRAGGPIMALDANQQILPAARARHRGHVAVGADRVRDRFAPTRAEEGVDIELGDAPVPVERIDAHDPSRRALDPRK